MARKAWDDLSATYRRRLQRSGITQAMYEAGYSLQSARGHGKAKAERQERGGLPRGRRGWDNLAERTKREYRRAGIDRAQYEAGAPLPGRQVRQFTTDPPRPRQAQDDLRQVGGWPLAAYQRQQVDDTTAWSLAMSTIPPPQEWRDAAIAFSDGDKPNTFIVNDDQGRQWRIALVAGNPTNAAYDLAKRNNVPVEADSPPGLR